MYAASLFSALASGNLHKYVATLCFALASANIHSGPQRAGGKAATAWSLAGFCKIGNGGGRGGALVNMAALPVKNLPWRP